MKTSFGGGVLGKGMQLRMDMDVYARGLSACENFELGQMGYARRRRGFAYVTEALDASSRVHAYVYSPSVTFLVEVGGSKLRVLSLDGYEVAEIAAPWSADEAGSVKASQLKKALILTHPNHQPMELLPADSSLSAWTLSEYELTHEPWYTLSLQDSTTSLLLKGSQGTLDFTETQDQVRVGDVLKFAYTVDSASHDVGGSDGFYPSADGVLCGGKWTLQVSGERGCTLKVQRRYSDGSWHDLATSITDIDAPSNNILAGDETDAMCYLRVKSTDNAGEWKDWAQTLVLNTWTRTLRLAVTGASSLNKATVPLSRPVDDTTWPIFLSGTTFSLIHNSETYSITLDYAGYEYLRFLLPDNLNISNQDSVKVVATQVADDYLNKARWYPEGTSFLPNQYELFPDSLVSGLHWRTKFKQLVNGTWADIELTSADAADCAVVLRNPSVSLYAGYPAGWYVLEFGRVFPADNNMNEAVLLDGCFGAVGAGCVSFGVDASINAITTALPTAETTTNDWSWCAWREAYGYPSTSFVHQQRVSFASTSAQPQTIWMSKTNDVSNFEVLTDYDDSSIAATLDTCNESSICWAHTKGADLCIGTQMGEYVIAAGDNTSTLTAANALAYPDGYVGASSAAASIVAADLVVYLERGSQRLRQLGYSEAANGYVSADITVLCPEVLEDGGGCVSLAYARKPDPVLYAVRADGKMAVCAFNPQQNVCAWHLFTTPNGLIKSAVTIPQETGGDWLFLRVERTSPDGSQTTQTIEVLKDVNDWQDVQLTNDGELTTCDFESYLLTTDMSSYSNASRESLNGSLNLLMAESCPAESVTCTVNGGKDWTTLNQQDELAEGWNKVNAASSNKDRRIFGFKVTGNRDFWCLGMTTISN